MKKLTVVGMGPGEYESMTLRAVKALNTCDVIVGYTVYVELAKPYFPDKEFLTTPMKREIERCEMAFAEAEKGRSVVMICSGDAGVYGMAGPILELAEKYPDVELEVIPGITAAPVSYTHLVHGTAGSGVCGPFPLQMGDFYEPECSPDLL